MKRFIACLLLLVVTSVALAGDIPIPPCTGEDCPGTRSVVVPKLILEILKLKL